jgi:glycosyltransferase involved in cell wall biosynthesis
VNIVSTYHQEVVSAVRAPNTDMSSRCVVFDGLAVITGGQVTRAKAFLRRFRMYDPQSRLIVLKSCDGWLEPDDKSEIEVIAVSLPQARGRAVGRMLWQNMLLPRFLKSVGADIYLSFSHYLPYTMPRGVTTIMGIANYAPFSELAKQAEVSLSGRLRLTMLKATILRSAKQAHKVIALSEALRRTLLLCGIQASKVAVIPNGVEQSLPTALTSDREQLAAYGIHGPFLLSVSHFYRYKNFERLIQAYAGLSEELRGGLPLVLIGEPHDRSYFQEIRRLITDRNLVNNVIVIPGLPGDRLSAFYRAATLFLFFSLVENSPNILLEAMSHGAPILASGIQPMPEFGQDAVRYVDPLDVPAMTLEMTALLNDAPAREALAKRAPAQAAHFNWDDFTAKVVSLYASSRNI